MTPTPFIFLEFPDKWAPSKCFSVVLDKIEGLSDHTSYGKADGTKIHVGESYFTTTLLKHEVIDHIAATLQSAGVAVIT